MPNRSSTTIEHPERHQRAGATTAEVAERFRVSDETVRRWVRAGRIPSFRAGILLRFDMDEVEASLRVAAVAAAEASDAR